MAEKFIVFDWKGKMAHFRQFDANSSSLSYSFPPPTVVMGMVAGLIGIERDGYYDLLRPEIMKIGVQIRTSPRKIMQSVNYIFAKNPNDLNMSNDTPHTQIPMELVTAEKFPEDDLHYRIILKIAEDEIYQKISEAVFHSRYKFLPYFGSAPFLSRIEPAGAVQKVNVIENSPVIVETIASVDSIDLSTLSMDAIDGKMPAFFREHVRREFKPGREPGDVKDVIWERNRGKIKAKFKKPVYQIELEKETIVASLF